MKSSDPVYIERFKAVERGESLFTLCVNEMAAMLGADEPVFVKNYKGNSQSLLGFKFTEPQPNWEYVAYGDYYAINPTPDVTADVRHYKLLLKLNKLLKSYGYETGVVYSRVSNYYDALLASLGLSKYSVCNKLFLSNGSLYVEANQFASQTDGWENISRDEYMQAHYLCDVNVGDKYIYLDGEGEYTVVCTSKPAGSMKIEYADGVVVYRSDMTGDYYHRTYEDFKRRMLPSKKVKKVTECITGVEEMLRNNIKTQYYIPTGSSCRGEERVRDIMKTEYVMPAFPGWCNDESGRDKIMNCTGYCDSEATYITPQSSGIEPYIHTKPIITKE